MAGTADAGDCLLDAVSAAVLTVKDSRWTGHYFDGGGWLGYFHYCSLVQRLPYEGSKCCKFPRWSLLRSSLPSSEGLAAVT